MLNWCINIQSDKKIQANLPQAPLMQPASTHQFLHLTRNVKTAEKTIRKIKPHPRKNSCNVAQPSLKMDKCVQVCTDVDTPKMVDQATQTPRLATETTQATLFMGSAFPSRQESLLRLWDRSSYMSGDYLKRSQQPQSSRSQKPSDLKIDNNIRTKATGCTIEAKDLMDRYGKSNIWGTCGVESYHFQPMDNKIQYQVQPTSPLHMKRLTLQESMVEPHSPLYHSKAVEDHSSSKALSYASKYREIYKNIETEFKRSRQRSQKPRRSERKIRTNDHQRGRRALFQRETIMSYTDQKKPESGELLIEESIIVERESRSFFTAISQTLYYEYYSTYMAQQNNIGLILSIKEIPIDQVDKISQQLLVYKELEQRQGSSEGILNLLQSQIDSESYLLIREPYTHTLKSYIISNPDITELTGQFQNVLERLSKLGLFLRQKIKMQDCVVVISELKVHNMSVFTLQNSEAWMEVDEAVLEMRRQMLHFLN